MLKLKEFGEANYLENCGVVSPDIGEFTIFENFPEECLFDKHIYKVIISYKIHV